MWRGCGLLCGLHFAPYSLFFSQQPEGPFGLCISDHVTFLIKTFQRLLITLRTKFQTPFHSLQHSLYVLLLWLHLFTFNLSLDAFQPLIFLLLLKHAPTPEPCICYSLCLVHSFPNIHMACSFISFWPLLKSTSSKRPPLMKISSISTPHFLSALFLLIAFTN